MAKTIPCSACKAQISKNTETCPQCGHPTSLGKMMSAIRFVGALGFVLVAVYALQTFGII